MAVLSLVVVPGLLLLLAGGVYYLTKGREIAQIQERLDRYCR